MLRLDIAWLMGTAWLARDPSSALPDWPPQPDRIFSALVASWGAGGEQVEERAALEWLERQDPPVIEEPCGFAARSLRPAPTVYVPPNDPTVSDITILPDRRRRHPRRFPAVSLDPDANHHLSLYWAQAAPEPHFAALNALAFRTSHIGHSASLVRCRFVVADTMPETVTVAQRAVYPGRHAELVDLHNRHMAGDERARPRPTQRPGKEPAALIRAPIINAFASDPASWVVFEHAGGERPDLRAAAILGDVMRMALMRAWTTVHGEAAPGWISGHEADGAPAREPHMAVVPLAFVGYPHADGSLKGLALVPPRHVTERFSASGPAAFAARQAFLDALAALGEPGRDESDSRVLNLAARSGSPVWQLRPRETMAVSLDPRRYVRRARLWASATPVLLDRHLKETGPAAEEEARGLVRQACARIGLPEPTDVQVTKYSAVRGAPPAWPSRGNPPWLNWSRKRSFGDRKLVHVGLAFEQPVPGPVLIGAGRFLGLGLCLPMREDES